MTLQIYVFKIHHNKWQAQAMAKPQIMFRLCRDMHGME